MILILINTYLATINNRLKIYIEQCRILYNLLQKMSVIFMFSSINQAKTHKYEFKHFIYENKQGFDGINPN